MIHTLLCGCTLLHTCAHFLHTSMRHRLLHSVLFMLSHTAPTTLLYEDSSQLTPSCAVPLQQAERSQHTTAEVQHSWERADWYADFSQPTTAEVQHSWERADWYADFFQPTTAEVQHSWERADWHKHTTAAATAEANDLGPPFRLLLSDDRGETMWWKDDPTPLDSTDREHMVWHLALEWKDDGGGCVDLRAMEQPIEHHTVASVCGCDWVGGWVGKGYNADNRTLQHTQRKAKECVNHFPVLHECCMTLQRYGKLERTSEAAGCR
ncbi:hypothetical protein DUNSADRAFT_17503 [Dunaliella salina]|uniref:Uncharacterized protein n=1 Tax=Dunaliella salina TaxID=3046 RepID=A0ABQ7G1M2_DUNSA|nr:hypothetical protein DUNSADRAFT_17503 [Dunaliella salina]|eukprot:KAF5828506.1 hypothetical protein DUNSADRAFT_17503 [Dunaliella salina]